MASLWDKYDSDTTYDEYLGEDNVSFFGGYRQGEYRDAEDNLVNGMELEEWNQKFGFLIHCSYFWESRH